jgi:sulfite exporter TauE/SafE
VAYTILGFSAAQLGRLLTATIAEFDRPIFVLCGLLISLLGFLIVLGRSPQPRLCQILRKQTVDSEIKGPVLLGLTVCIMPCLYVLSVLAYIAIKAGSPLQGALYGLSFGIGKFLSPLILLGVLSNTLPAMLIKDKRIYTYFKCLCGAFLFLIGIRLMVQ